MRKWTFAVAGIAATAVLAATAYAASSKFAANVSTTSLVPSTDADFSPVDVLEIGLHTANKTDLLIGVSLETSLFTQTKVKGKNGGFDSETASGTIEVCVDVDGQDANVFPECVTFDHREQTLEATLGGVIESCEDTCTFDANTNTCTGDPDGVITVEFECVVTDEDINLILDTMAAHHFNFVAVDMTSGDHDITVSVSGDVENTSDDSSAMVGVGQGSLTVEAVRATNDGTGIDID